MRNKRYLRVPGGGGDLRLLQSLGILATGAVLVGLVAKGATPRTFEPDGTFTGSKLSASRTVGQATWTAMNGEITGTGKGWLVFDKPYQDLQLEASWRCVGECQTGIMVRAEKTPDGGMKGVYVSLTTGDLFSYHVTFDAQGNVTSRERLRASSFGGTGRVAEQTGEVLPFLVPLGSSATPQPQTPVAGRGGAGPGRGPAGGRGNQAPNLPKAGEWNVVGILIDVNILRVQLNYANGIAGGVADEAYGRYGPFALYVGGGEVKYKDIAYKDIQPRVMPEEIISPRFRMQKLSDYYYSWGPAVADFNRDGIADIVAGPYVYFGPDYHLAREIWPALTLNPSTQFFNGLQYAVDVTGDGYPDVINCILRAPIRLFVNPGKEQRRWDAYDITVPVSNEQWAMKDLNGDGVPDIVFKDGESRLVWADPDPKNPTALWIKHPISEAGPWPQHGLGVGDVNADGRLDVLDSMGWWENPGKEKMSEPWPFHPESFGRTGARSGGADIAVFDINGDGLNDVMTSLHAHGFGIAWYEQKKTADGQISFVEHLVMDDYSTKAANAGGVTFSEIHGSNIADINGDGIPDFVTGKREWSELDTWTDPDAYGTPVLYVYRTVREKAAPGGARFVPELISNRSGVGSTVSLVDLNGDKRPEIITSTRRGTFIFWNNWKK